MHIVTETDPHSGALFARNAYGREWADRIVFVQVSEGTRTTTGNRAEFIGRNGALSRPAALYRTRLSGKTGAGLAPCAALQARIDLADGEEQEVVFILGVARSGEYQSGGAYGFRDQLQDTTALIHATPWLAREQLLRCAGRQFPQGDVQHWWHPPGGQGVRTHFSDDYLWLPYATCRYVTMTGDTGVLDESVHFLEGRPLNPEEEAYYDHPQRSPEAASLYEHC